MQTQVVSFIFGNFRDNLFNQKCPVQPVSEFRGAWSEHEGRTHGQTKDNFVSDIGYFKRPSPWPS